MRKKILVDIYLAYNIGDDMFLDHLANSYPDVDFVPLHPGKNYDSFFSNYKNVTRFPYSFLDKLKSKVFKNKLEDYDWMSNHFDALLFLGGGIFREESYWPEVYQYRNAISDAFIAKDKKVWFMGCSFGPFNTSEFRHKYSELFNKVTRINFRDQYSYNLFPEISNSGYYPDILWSYNLPKSEREDNVLGISIINPKHKEGKSDTYGKYLNAHINLCRDYINRGFTVKLFSFCEAEGDLEIAKEIQGVIPETKIINYTGRISEFLQEFGKCSQIVAARFHANIIAIKYGIPLLPISYGTKTDSLLEDLQFRGLNINLDNTFHLESGEFYLFLQDVILQMKNQSEQHLTLDGFFRSSKI